MYLFEYMKILYKALKIPAKKLKVIILLKLKNAKPTFINQWYCYTQTLIKM